METTPKTRWKPNPYHLLALLPLIVLAGFIAFRLRLKSGIQKNLDAIRAAGYPVTCVELDRWYTIPEGVENAADYLIEAFSYYQQWVGERRELLPVVGQGDLPLRPEPLAEETKEMVAEYLGDNREALELLHKGAAVKHCRYPVDFTKGMATVIPYLSEAREGARFLQLETVLHTENDRPELALNSIISILGLGRTFSNEPTLIAQLVRISCQAVAVQAFEYSANRAEFTDEQLVNVGRSFANAQDLSAMSRAVVGERCQGIEFFADPDAQAQFFQSTGSSGPPAALMVLYRAAGLSDKDASVYLHVMEDYMKANELPLEERCDAADVAEDKLENVPKIQVLLRVLSPAFSRITELDLRVIGHLRTAEGGAAIQRYRLAAGQLPDTLADLVPAYLDAVPKDPFDGGELRYKKLEKGFVVYSIGEDEKDDGGKEKPQRKERKDKSTYDVTFIIER